MTGEASPAPYVGLRPFRTPDAGWFFGRDRESASLSRKLRGCRFTAVVGASGSGKSSLVLAGVLPQLEADGWQPIVVKPGSAPIAKLATALAAAGPGADDPFGQARRFHFDACLRASAFGLTEVVASVAREAPRLILVVDQLEELFRYGQEAAGSARAAMREEGRAFIELLLTGAQREGSRLHVVLTMRSDYFGNCANYRGLAEAVSASQYLVPVPGRDQLETAIRGPVQKAQGAIDEGLVQRLLVEVEDETDRLPLLQHTLRRLWETAGGEPRRLTDKDYVAVGGLAGSIDRKADAIFDELTKAHTGDAGTVQRIMKALTGLDEQGRATRRAQRKSELMALLADDRDTAGRPVEASLDRVLAAYAAEGSSYLQVDEGEDPEADIGHEALIRSWKRLAGEKLDFKTGWLREERADGDAWRGYVRRSLEGPLLSAAEQQRVGRWTIQHRLGPNWAQRYGDEWRAVQSLRCRSLRTSAVKAASVLLVGVMVGSFAWWQSQERSRAQLEALRNARLGAISLAERARSVCEDGNARAGALLARAALPSASAPSQDDQRYVAQAEAALADALAGRALEVMRLVGHEARVSGVAFSPDGKRLATASDDRTVRLWDAATGQPVGAPLLGHGAGVYGVAFSPDGKRLATASADRTVRLWDAATGQPVGAPLLGHGAGVLGVAFSPDGKRLATASWDRTVRLWDAATGQPVGAPLLGHGDSVYGVAFSPDGKRLATASADWAVRLWDAATGQPVGAPLLGHEGGVLGVAFSPDGKRLATASDDRTVRLWDAATGQPVGAPLLGHEGGVLGVAFSPDGKRLATASDDRTVRLWDAATGQPVGAPLLGHGDNVLGVAFSPDGKRLATASDDRTVRLWDATTGQPVGAPLLGHRDNVLGVAFSPDGKRLATASDDRTVRLWDAATGQPVGAPLLGHGAGVYGVAFSPDGKRLATASDDRTVRLWDAATGQPVGAPLLGHGAGVYGVAFSPDGKRLATASADWAVRLWDAATGQPVGAPLLGHGAGVSGVAFSPDGKRLATASDDRTVRLWDAATGQPVGAPLLGHGAGVSGVAFSPDGKRLATASADWAVRLWDAATGQPVGAPLLGHGAGVSGVAFSPDGKRLATASWDRTVRLWDAATGQPVGAPLLGHGGVVSGVAFSPDGKRLATASWDRTVRLWDVRSANVPLPELISRAEALCPLSKDERARFGLADPMFPDESREWSAAQRRACGWGSGSADSGL